MTFRESFFQVKQLLVSKLQSLGISAANMNLGWTSLLNLKITSSLSINVPLSLIYSDNFNISGVLSNTANKGLISGATVKLKVGGTVVDTTTTNLNGEYSFTKTPVHRGTHSFQVVYDGNNSFNSCESTIITREIGKETSVLTASPSSQYVSIGDSVTISGCLTDDDGSILSGETISLLVDDTVEDTTTTNVNGEYSFTFTYPDNSNHTLKTSYEGDSNYTASECNVNIILMITSSITLANQSDIVSLHGSVTSTMLTATVLDQNLNGLEGLSVAWYVDDVLADTTTTDSNGETTYTYTATSSGEVCVRAVCMSLSETCIIHDVFYVNVPNQQNVVDFTANGNSSITYDSTNQAYLLEKLSNDTITSITLDNILFSNTVKIKADLMLSNSGYVGNLQAGIGLIYEDAGINAKITHARDVNYYGMNVLESKRTNYGSNEQGIDLTSADVVLNRWYSLVVEINTTTIIFKLYSENVLLGTINYNSSVLSTSNNQLALYIGFTRNSRVFIKNIQVMEL